MSGLGEESPADVRYVACTFNKEPSDEWLDEQEKKTGLKFKEFCGGLRVFRVYGGMDAPEEWVAYQIVKGTEP